MSKQFACDGCKRVIHDGFTIEYEPLCCGPDDYAGAELSIIPELRIRENNTKHACSIACVLKTLSPVLAKLGRSARAAEKQGGRTK